MDTDVLRTFLMLAREGHMTRAAFALHLTQPAVSAQLKRLEGEMGQSLFDRGPKGLMLTEAGHVFLPFARETLQSLERGKEAMEELEELQRGSFSLGGGATAVTYLLPPILGRFYHDYPKVNIFIREQGSSQTLASVLAGDLDLGIVTMPMEGELSRVHRTLLHAEFWVEDELYLMVPSQHRLQRKKKFVWEDLEEQALVLFEAGSAVRELIDDGLKNAGVEPRIAMELRSIESIKQMVHQGIGAGFVSRYALAEKQKGLSCKEGRLTRQLAVIYRKDRTMSRAAEIFFGMMMSVSHHK